MSSIWSNAAGMTVESPFATSGGAPKPGGTKATRMQSTQGQGNQTVPQPGLSPGVMGGVGQLKPMATPSATAGTPAAGTGGAITSNDFLTLLVTEMQNQDPTSQTDPNAYVNQLVQINSLEQLISMNQNLALVLGTVTSPVPTGHAIPAGNGQESSTTALGPVLSGGQVAQSGSQGTYGNLQGNAASGSRPAAHGNLSMPAATPAAHAVAHALDGRAHQATKGPRIRDIPVR